MSSYFRSWTKADEQSVVQLTAITGDPGKLWPYPFSALTSGLSQGMPNIKDCFISGYIDPKMLEHGKLEAIGELVVTRENFQPITGKAYVFLIALDEEKNAYCRGPFKPVDGHYFDPNDAVPVDKLFGKIDLTNLDKTKL